MARECYQERGEAYEADVCQRELAALPDDAARLCFLKRYRRRLMDDLHVAQEKLACIDYMIYELEQKRLDR
ncbi:hypothetical protein [uncultured Mitsuokella sp.]|uniref:hypothetical protein n=1 Tax=uncultured Mitsuokella sp. TaxID=453120 RepID=UPI0025921B89|nr:hypothetical protein [uncultured Mitsuokella sp.]